MTAKTERCFTFAILSRAPDKEIEREKETDRQTDRKERGRCLLAPDTLDQHNRNENVRTINEAKVVSK